MPRRSFQTWPATDLVPHRSFQHVFPLLYLLLKRDFEIMRFARTQCLHVDELYDSMSTILWVFDAVNDRHDDLAGVFASRKVDFCGTDSHDVM